MFDPEKLKRLMTRYLCFILSIMFAGCAVVSAAMTIVMFIGMLQGNWAFLHVLAMFIITCLFAMISAIFLALNESAGGKSWVRSGV